MDLHLRLASTLFWLFMLLSSVLLFPIALVIWALTAPFDRRRWLLHRFTSLWASLYTWLNPAWPITLEGREKWDDRRAYVVVANHLSLVDILVLFRLFKHFKWVSKIENFRVPFIGWNMWLNRYIPLVRGDAASARKMLEACKEALAEGSSVMIFPEGTRSKDGRLRPFKSGAFRLALQCKVPILPIVIEGTGDALPKAGYILRGRHPIRVRILDPIEPEAFQGETVESLTARVRQRFARELGEEAPAAGGTERVA
ncbi:MAG: 1-acyl-sn-glycerol-3-phosphate acyltransferase [Deltaproteobacteria bacterium]|nr:MAG: 1-acyl-sn-glycerol-3-phosphate acyltransferase [Deltaproteobacteria bacterium]